MNTTIMEATRAVPEGYENITPHLVVKGAAKAIEFYKKVNIIKNKQFLITPLI